ncbi:MAG: sugar-transfer associated ATP-grasp domain-containing protein, partial [Candidatus Thermoplasmatota archaeon]|nr:sugar-transfer associated ATP-grasp domain-containing protein [Candidatus Thermoplasmatota archaeon]
NKFLATIGKKKDYIIQPGLIQHDELSRIYPHSVNTFRIATENSNGNVRLLCATLRMGQRGMEVDNGTQGGLLVKIDVEKGTFSDYATTEENEYFEKHPDTNFVFKKYQLKNWKDIKEFTIEATQKLSDFAYLGWDIALTDSGPVAIETNFKFGLDHYQVALGGLREILEITDPDFYWKNKGKRI